MVGMKLGVWGRELSAGWRGIKVEAIKSYYYETCLLASGPDTQELTQLAALTSKRITSSAVYCPDWRTSAAVRPGPGL